MASIEHKNILLNLKIIAMLRQHEKFRTQNNTIVVDKSGFMQALQRWLMGETRTLNLQFIREVYDRALLCIQRLGNEKNETNKMTMVCTTSAEDVFNSNRGLDTKIRDRVISALKNSLVGLENLKTTYERDFRTVASIQILIDELQDKLACL